MMITGLLGRNAVRGRSKHHPRNLVEAALIRASRLPTGPERGVPSSELTLSISSRMKHGRCETHRGGRQAAACGVFMQLNQDSVKHLLAVVSQKRSSRATTRHSS